MHCYTYEQSYAILNDWQLFCRCRNCSIFIRNALLLKIKYKCNTVNPFLPLAVRLQWQGSSQVSARSSSPASSATSWRRSRWHSSPGPWGNIPPTTTERSASLLRLALFDSLAASDVLVKKCKLNMWTIRLIFYPKQIMESERKISH